MSQDFTTMFAKPQFRINYIPIDSRERISRWGGQRRNSVANRDFTIEEIEAIVRSGELSAIRELSRYYYRTNGRYRNAIEFLSKEGNTIASIKPIPGPLPSITISRGL